MADQQRELGVYVKGINEETTEDDCMAAFSSFGEITEVFLKSERGFALVQFSTRAAAEAAAAAGVGYVGSATVSVAARTPPKEKSVYPDSVNIYMNGLNESTSEDEIVGILGAFGEVVAVELQGARGFAYITMGTVEAAVAAVAATDCEMRGSTPRDRTRRAKKSSGRGARSRAPKDLSKEIYIKGLTPESPEASNKDAIREIFGAYGNVVRVTVRNDRDFAFVSYEDAASVAEAVEASYGGLFINGESVTVEARTGKVRARADAPEY
jgi:RNA recognition motif-containing protein